MSIVIPHTTETVNSHANPGWNPIHPMSGASWQQWGQGAHRVR